MSTHPLRIAFVNHGDIIEQAAFRAAVDVIDRQLRLHVNPAWSTHASAGIYGEMTGVDCVAHVQGRANVPHALAYHTVIAAGKPMIVVGLDVCKAAGVSWTSAASHEAVETACDPNCDRHALGEIGEVDGLVLVDREACDPVQGDTYVIDDVELSNFVLPAWFHRRRQAGKLDYLGKLSAPFTIAPGGYVSYTDPDTGESGQVFADDRARAIRKAKVQAGVNRSRGRAMNVPAFIAHVIALGKEVGADLRRDPDGRVRLTLPELGRIVAAAGLVIVDAAGNPANMV